MHKYVCFPENVTKEYKEIADKKLLSPQKTHVIGLEVAFFCI